MGLAGLVAVWCGSVSRPLVVGDAVVCRCVVIEYGDSDIACGVAGHLLVASWWHWSSRVVGRIADAGVGVADGVDDDLDQPAAHHRGSSGPGSLCGRSPAGCRPGVVVLRRQVVLAIRTGLHLPSLVDRFDLVHCMGLSIGCRGASLLVVVSAFTCRPRPTGGGVAVCRHPGSSAGFRRCLPDAVFVRCRSFPVPGQHTPVDGRGLVDRHSLVRDSWRRPGAGVGCLEFLPFAGFQRLVDSLERHGEQEPHVGVGIDQPGQRAASSRFARVGRASVS